MFQTRRAVRRDVVRHTYEVVPVWARESCIRNGARPCAHPPAWDKAPISASGVLVYQGTWHVCAACGQGSGRGDSSGQRPSWLCPSSCRVSPGP